MSYLFHLPLRGLGTIEVEALGSYIHRLAFNHGTSVNRLLSHAYAWHGRQRPGFRDSVPELHSRGTLAVYVRPNNATNEMTQVLSNAAAAPELRSGTFLAVNDALHRSTGVFSQHLRWCPSCMAEFIKANDDGYFKLAWHLAAISHCHIHGVKLLDRCCHCGGYQDGYGIKHRCTHCQKCHQPLSESSEFAERTGSWEVHGADLLDLIDEISKDPELIYPKESVRRLISNLFDKAWTDDTQDKLWKLIPRDECLRIESGHLPVTMIVARRIAFRLGMKLTDLLWGDLQQSTHVLDPAWTREYPNDIHPKKRRRITGKEEIFQKVNETLNNQQEYAPSLSQLAKELSVSVGYLRHHFPVMAERIIQNHKVRKAEHQLELKRKSRAAALKFFTAGPEGIGVKCREQAYRQLRGKSGLSKHQLKREINSVYELLCPPPKPLV